MFLNKMFDILLKIFATIFTSLAIYWYGKKQQKAEQENDSIKNANKVVTSTLEAERRAASLDNSTLDNILRK